MDQAQLSKYRQALLGVDGIQAPGGTMNANGDTAAAIGHLQNMYRGTFQAGAAKAGIGAAGGAAKADADQQDANAKLALQQEQDKASQLDQQKKDLLDPSKYTQQIDENGGYKFYDPTGQEIDAKQYSSATGKHITDILKKSQNPADQQFVQDYGQIEKIGQIMQSGDKKALEDLYKKQPDLKKQIDGKTYSQIVTDFRKFYPQFFNTSQPATVKTTYANQTPGSLGDNAGGIGGFIKSLFGG